MDSFQNLAPVHAFFWPAVIAAAIYGVRYLFLATLAFRMGRRTDHGSWGRPHSNAPVNPDLGRHIRRELGYSALTIQIIALINASLWGWGLLKYSQLYFRLDTFSLLWFIMSIPVMLLLHATFFYWMHRLMHTRRLFALTHRVHHLSVHITAFAAYSFHPAEALGEALIVTIIIFMIPVHPLAFLVFQTLSTAYNVYGHCGREFYPKSMSSHPLGRWINTSTAHATHHGRGRYNYGLYFLFWDRWMGTIDTQYR